MSENEEEKIDPLTAKEAADELNAERKALIEIAGKCLEALDPELGRKDLVAVMRHLYAISSDFPSPNEDD